MHPSRSPRALILTLALLMLVAAALPALAQRGDDANRKSKNGKTEGTIDGVGIVLEYGRPQVRERALWGELVPYGKVWRTGADEATTITFDKDATVEGGNVAAGTYALFTIPGENEWTLILNSAAKQWGAFEYSEDQDVLRVNVTPAAGEHVEAMDFVIEGDTVHLRWGTLTVPFTVAAQ